MLLIVLTAAQLSLGMKAQNHEDPTTAERELRMLEREWDTAIVARDIPTLKRLLHEDFTYIDSRGDAHTKSDIIDGIKTSEAAIQPFETEDVQVMIYGEAAVLTGRF